MWLCLSFGLRESLGKGVKVGPASPVPDPSLPSWPQSIVSSTYYGVNLNFPKLGAVEDSGDQLIPVCLGLSRF